MIVAMVQTFIEVSATAAYCAADEHTFAASHQSTDQRAAARATHDGRVPFPPMFAAVPVTHQLVGLLAVPRLREYFNSRYNREGVRGFGGSRRQRGAVAQTDHAQRRDCQDGTGDVDFRHELHSPLHGWKVQ